MSDNYWDRIADLWRLFGPPIRPAADDLVVYQEIVDRATALIDGPPRVLLLGVTPNCTDCVGRPMPRSSRARQFVTDARSRVGGPPTRRDCLVDWVMPFADQSFTLLLCDAGVGLLDPLGQGSCSLRCNGCWSRMERLRCACSRPRAHRNGRRDIRGSRSRAHPDS